MSILFKPIAINGMVVPNRFLRSATNDRYADISGRVTDALMEIYEGLALGGPGLIATGHASVTGNGKAGPTMLGAHHDDLIPGLKRLAQVVHRHDAKIMLQINHAGRQTASATIGETPLAPSAVYNPVTRETPKALTEDEIEALIAAYAAAAGRAVSAGFDAVQIHAAHGYLISQFISPHTNRRTDRWGGSPENRMRFPLAVLRRIRKTVGERFPVTVKLNSEDGMDGGLTAAASAGIAGALSREGIDAIEISGGMPGSSLSGIRPNILKEADEAYYLPNARKFKAAISVPLFLVGGLRTPDLMERLLETGEVDMVALCRPFIREPDLVNQWKRGGRKKPDCISCNGCLKYRDEPVRCIMLKASAKNSIS